MKLKTRYLYIIWTECSTNSTLPNAHPQWKLLSIPTPHKIGHHQEEWVKWPSSSHLFNVCDPNITNIKQVRHQASMLEWVDPYSHILQAQQSCTVQSLWVIDFLSRSLPPWFLQSTSIHHTFNLVYFLHDFEPVFWNKETIPIVSSLDQGRIHKMIWFWGRVDRDGTVINWRYLFFKGAGSRADNKSKGLVRTLWIFIEILFLLF